MYKILILILLCFISLQLQAVQQKIIIGNLIITGNKVTKERTIYRELTFNVADTLLISDLEMQIKQSRNNLLNTSLFHFVTITYKITELPFITININVEERWYTWPMVSINYADRNFSSWLQNSDFAKSNYGLILERYNFRGRNENLKFIFVEGYTQKLAISYANFALDKAKKKIMGALVERIRQNEIIYKTLNNSPVSYKQSNHYAFQQLKSSVNFLYRPQLYTNHNFILTFLKFNVADTIIKLNPDYLQKGQKSQQFAMIDYVFSIDKRDFKPYPLHGFYFEVIYNQKMEVAPSASFFSYLSILPSVYKYIQFNNRIAYATGFNLKMSLNKNYSYLNSKALGYSRNLHGFEYNVIDGQHYALFRNLFKFTALPTKILYLKFLPYPTFNKIHYSIYFNVYADCGYVVDKYTIKDNTYANQFLYSYGAGFDFVTYYDRILRLEYSITKFGLSGIFVHLSAPLNK